MDIKEYLNNVCKQIKYKPANKVISEELESHIQDMKSDYLCKGFSENEAEENAIKQMGNAKKIGKKLNKIHRPKIDWITLIFSLCAAIISLVILKPNPVPFLSLPRDKSDL